MKLEKIDPNNDPTLHTDKFSHYIEMYGSYLNQLKDKDLNILEIGVKKGESLRLWKSFFKKANIVGVDINSDCKKHEEDRVKVIIGDQNQKETFNEISDIKFDIIIDDGSHVGDHIINTFNYTFYDMLSNGGFYFIEDIGMIFHNTFNGHKQNLGKFELFMNNLYRCLDLDTFSWNQIRQRNRSRVGNRFNENHPVARKIEYLTGHKLQNFNNKINFIHRYPNLIAIKKKKNPDEHFGKIIVEENF